MREKQLLPIFMLAVTSHNHVFIPNMKVESKSFKYKIIVNFHLFTLKSGHKFDYKLLKWVWRSYHFYTSTKVKRHLIYVINIFFWKLTF